MIMHYQMYVRTLNIDPTNNNVYNQHLCLKFGLAETLHVHDARNILYKETTSTSHVHESLFAGRPMIKYIKN